MAHLLCTVTFHNMYIQNIRHYCFQIVNAWLKYPPKKGQVATVGYCKVVLLEYQYNTLIFFSLKLSHFYFRNFEQLHILFYFSSLLWAFEDIFLWMNPQSDWKEHVMQLENWKDEDY